MVCARHVRQRLRLEVESLASYWSRKERIFLLREGCFSFRKALASICLIRSRVTLTC
jgi:hypothetical protein